MKTLTGLFLALAIGTCATTLQADTLSIPVGQQAAATASLPQRGSTTADVLRHRGEPVRRHAPVGQPPIARWDYGDYSVYFEGNRVIHSVRQHRPMASN